MKAMVAWTLLAGVTWSSLWWTPDQQGHRLLQRGEFLAAAEAFEDPVWQGVAWFRGGEFAKAEQAFAREATPEAEFNRGNCLVMLGKYDAAADRYERALELRPDWADAQVNREIAVARARLVARRGAEMGDQQVGADEITMEKSGRNSGEDTLTEGPQALSTAEMQALWLRRVQTKPADFLRAKFAHQLGAGDSTGGRP